MLQCTLRYCCFHSYFRDKYEDKKDCRQGEHTEHEYPRANIDEILEGKGHQCHDDDRYT